MTPRDSRRLALRPTSVRLKSVPQPTLRRALEAAWRLAAPEPLSRRFDEIR